MGYDMYCVAEALNKKSGKWECFGVSKAERNYSLFSRIADIANSEDEETYIEPIEAPRGWPLDVSGPAEAWRDDCSIHFSDTWLCLAELKDLNKLIQGNLWKMLRLNHLSDFFNLEKGWKKAAFTRYSDLRILFFFDR